MEKAGKGNVLSKIRCKKCKQILESKHIHDFQVCECGTFVDGGNEYLRIGAKNPQDIEILEYPNEEE